MAALDGVFTGFVDDHSAGLEHVPAGNDPDGTMYSITSARVEGLLSTSRSTMSISQFAGRRRSIREVPR